MAPPSPAWPASLVSIRAMELEMLCPGPDAAERRTFITESTARLWLASRRNCFRSAGSPP